MWSSEPTPRRRIAFGFVLATSLLVAGCGFQPMYAKSNNGDALKQHLSAVEVGVITDREGQMLRNALERRFERGAGNRIAKRYRLDVTLSEQKVESSFLRDNTGSRATLTMTAMATLMMGDKRLWWGQSQSTTAYNVLPEHFSVEMSLRSARERAIEQLADDISQSVAMFLSQNPNLSNASPQAGTRP